MRALAHALSLCTLLTAQAQQGWDMKDPGPHVSDRCSDLLRTLGSKPKEVQFGFFLDDQQDIWFVVNDVPFFEQLFRHSRDGLAVDVVGRDRYTCGKELLPWTGWSKGTLLKPTYLPELKKGLMAGEDGTLYTKVGRLPVEFTGMPVELNLVLLQDRYICHYTSFYDLKSYRWDLLNMGLFMDSLTYQDRHDTGLPSRSANTMRQKTLHFTIPFHKGRGMYSPADLQPLVDSLRLTNFIIRRIDIRAFSIVDGSEEANIRLQEERARSIADALQSFQEPGITSTVSASENWVEFQQDVSATRHSPLARMTREQVKEELRKPAVGKALEPMLARHRKAVVTLELERRTDHSDVTTTRLVDEFERSIAEQNMQHAMRIQNEVFERILSQELPTEFLDRMEVPKKKPFALLLNSRAAFRQFLDPSDVYGTYQALLELDQLSPGNGMIKYNLCAVKFRIWLLGEQAVDPDVFNKEIDRLRSYKIAENLVRRMHINRNIILAEYHMRRGDYARKDECLTYIHRNYKEVPMNDQDHLSLAQYFTSFGNQAWALEVVTPLLTRFDVNRDLFFYYLNMTMIDEVTTAEPDLRKVIQHAIELDRRRFCALFKPYGKGGITFQLLENNYLRTLHCTHCSGVYDL